MTPLKRFQEDMEKGWDYAINNLYIRIMRKDSTSNEDVIILAYIYQYNAGFEYMTDNVDDGICYLLRNSAVFIIQKILEAGAYKDE